MRLGPCCANGPLLRYASSAYPIANDFPIQWSAPMNSKYMNDIKPAASQTALLLIAHGSREQAANADLHRLAAKLRETNCYATIESSFLELERPTIDEGADRCVARGARKIIIL